MGRFTMPFVLQFCGSASSYLWEDEEGVVHTIVQAEGGGEQGDPLVLALFSLGQHPALHQLQDGERLFAFLDNVYVVCALPRGQTRFMGSCSMSSSPIRPFEFTTGRLKCGTEEVWLHCALRCCRQWPESTTQMRLCGEAIPLCAGRTKVCGFWAHHWDRLCSFPVVCAV